MLAKLHDVEWRSTGRQATQKPDPNFPNGLTLDFAQSVHASKTCVVKIPYPAQGVGAFIVKCHRCGLSLGLTAAGRTDDPREVILPCYYTQTTVAHHIQMSDGLTRRPFKETNNA